MSETVIAAPSNNGKIYHTNFDCPHLPDTQRELTKQNVKKMGYRECEVCKNGKKIVRDQQLSLRQKLQKQNGTG